MCDAATSYTMKTIRSLLVLLPLAAGCAEKVPPATPAHNTATYVQRSGPGTVGAGTRLLLRMNAPLDSSHMAPGQRFAATLEVGLADGAGNMVVPPGTTVFGVLTEVQRAGRLFGRSELELAFTDLRIHGRLVRIRTQDIRAVGEDKTRDTAVKAAAGAIIGGVIGGGEGIVKGAAIGGAVALLTRGPRVQVPAGTLLEAALVAPVFVGVPD